MLRNGEDVLGADPRVRHVAEVARAARVAPGDLRPLVPRARPAVAEEELGELGRVVASAEVDERADDADLVGGVVVPVDLAARGAGGSPPGTRRTSASSAAARQVADAAEQRDRVRGRGRVEVGPLDRSRHVVDARASAIVRSIDVAQRRAERVARCAAMRRASASSPQDRRHARPRRGSPAAPRSRPSRRGRGARGSPRGSPTRAAGRGARASPAVSNSGPRRVARSASR